MSVSILTLVRRMKHKTTGVVNEVQEGKELTDWVIFASDICQKELGYIPTKVRKQIVESVKALLNSKHREQVERLRSILGTASIDILAIQHRL